MPATTTSADTAAGPAPQVVNLSLVIGTNDAFFRLMALLHRKRVLVTALIWLPGDGHLHRRRLWLAIDPGRLPAGHVIALIRQVIGVEDLRLGDAPPDRLRPALPGPREIPTRYLVWRQPIG